MFIYLNIKNIIKKPNFNKFNTNWLIIIVKLDLFQKFISKLYSRVSCMSFTHAIIAVPFLIQKRERYFCIILVIILL